MQSLCCYPSFFIDRTDLQASCLDGRMDGRTDTSLFPAQGGVFRSRTVFFQMYMEVLAGEKNGQKIWRKRLRWLMHQPIWQFVRRGGHHNHGRGRHGHRHNKGEKRPFSLKGQEQCVWRVGEVSPFLLSSLTLQGETFQVGTLQRHYKKISDAWKRFTTKNVINLFQASEISIVW